MTTFQVVFAGWGKTFSIAHHITDKYYKTEWWVTIFHVYSIKNPVCYIVVTDDVQAQWER